MYYSNISSQHRISNDYNLENMSSLDFDDIEVKDLKVVVVGDGYIGKTCMLWSYVYKKFPSGYLPTVFDIHSSKWHLFFNFIFLVFLF